MWLFLLALAFASQPKLKPVSMSFARHQLQGWYDETGDDEFAVRYLNSLNKYRVEETDTLKAMSILKENQVCGMLLLELVSDHVVIRNIEAKDFYSGSELIHALARNKNITFSTDLDSRWHIALRFFRS